MWTDSCTFGFVLWDSTGLELFISSLLLLGATLGEAAPSGLGEMELERGDCPTGWHSFNGRCYHYVASHMTWAEAELHCVSLKANLVSIHSLQEQDFVTGLIKQFDSSPLQTWIGLSDRHKERGWMWSDGCPVTFQHWHNGQPDNTAGLEEHCAEVFWGGQPRWNDHKCHATLPFVCASRKPVC